MTDDELINLLTGPESEHLERKESLSSGATSDRVRQAICAFANDLPGSGRPGIVGIGIHDDGRPSGLEANDELELKLSQMRDDGKIVPFPSMEVRRLKIGENDVVAAIVQPSSNPPGLPLGSDLDPGRP